MTTFPFLLQSLFHGVVFTIYYALQDFGFFSPQDSNPLEALNQTASQEESREQLEKLAMESYHRLIYLMTFVSSEGMVRTSTNVIRPTILCVGFFGIEKAEREMKRGAKREEIEVTLKEVEVTIEALATADSSKTTPSLVALAKSGLGKARQMLEDRESKMSSEGRTGDNGSGSEADLASLFQTSRGSSAGVNSNEGSNSNASWVSVDFPPL